MNNYKFTISFVVFILLSTLSFGMYNPEAGRFMQRDPLGINPAGEKENPFVVRRQFSAGYNLYDYCNSNPVVKLDPDGLMPKACCRALLPKLLGNPIVKPFYDDAIRAKDLDGRPCLKDIKCESCPSGWMGYYNSKRRTLVLCTNEGKGYSLNDVRETIIHELIHAIQCDPTRSCGHCMRLELEAYYYSGMCTGTPPPGMTQEEYCLSRAMGSCGSVCKGVPWQNFIGRFIFPPERSGSPR